LFEANTASYHLASWFNCKDTADF